MWGRAMMRETWYSVSPSTFVMIPLTASKPSRGRVAEA